MRRSGKEGITLIEIMIVLAIISIVAMGATYGIGAITRTNLRSACMSIVSASRFAYNRAVAQGTTVRVVLDMDAGTVAIEEAHGRVTLARASDERVAASPEDDGAAVDPWEAAKARLENTMEPTFGASPFGPLRGREGEVLDRYKARPLGNRIRVVRMLLPHEPVPREHGRGAIYFFPSGRTEHAVVQLGDNSDTVYSVEIHALTGRGTVYTDAYEPALLGDDESELRDPG